MIRFLYLAAFSLALLAAGCSRQPSIVGFWRTSPPSSLSYEIRSDHSIWLTQHGKSYRMFGYKLLDSDTLQLFDGMGRMRQYDFRINGDQLELYDSTRPDAPSEVWLRQPSR